MPYDRPDKWLTFSLLGLLFLVLLIRPVATPPAQQPQENPLEQAYQRALAVGVYDFAAEAQQTLRPRSIPEMIGQTSQSVNMSLDGEAVSPYEAHLTVRMEGAGLDPTPVTLVQEGSHK